MRRKIACVLNKSPTFQADYVGRLYSGISEHLESFEFVAVQSTWPGWWSKMELFDPAINGDILYFDLDTIIVGPIDELFTGYLTLLADFNVPKLVETGVMFLPEVDREEVWSAWSSDPQAVMKKYRTDGAFLREFYSDAYRWQDVLPGKLVSYKNHCRQVVPRDASVVCFHGRPKPKDIGWKLACG